MDISRAARRLAMADAELAEHFTSALGVRAQGYEPSTSSGYDSNEQHVVLRESAHRRAIATHAAVSATFRRLAWETQITLRSIYDRGAGVLHETAGKVEDVALLSLALQPNWGHGMFTRLAAEQDRARAAFGRRFPNREPTRGAVLEFLTFEAGAGAKAIVNFTRLSEDCEAIRVGCLIAYDERRIERLRGERTAKYEARKDREALLERELGRRRAKDAERIERRMRGAA